MNTPNERGLVKKTIWVAPDGFETESEEEARRYVDQRRIRDLTEEYVAGIDFSTYRPRARTAQTTMATYRVLDFLRWATQAGKVKIS